MRIYIDIDSRRLLSAPGRPISKLEFKRRDNDTIELIFIREDTVQELAAGTTAKIGVKADADYNSDFLAVTTLAKTGTGTSTVYTGELNFNTTAMAAAFSAEPVTLAAMLEVEWISGTAFSSSKTLPVTLHNDVIRGDEGAPATLPLFYSSATSDFKATQSQAEAGTDNSAWMTPLRTAQAIVALGGGAGTHTHSLADLQQSGASIGQVATYNGTAWVPQDASSGGVTSYNDLTNVPSTFPPSGHNHAATEITSGTIAIARIPTGTTSTTVALGNHTHVGQYMPVAGGITSISVQSTLPSEPDPTVLYILTS